MFPIACVLEGKFIRIFTLVHLDATQIQGSFDTERSTEKYDSEEVRDQVVDDSEIGVRLLSPVTEERLQAHVQTFDTDRTGNSTPTIEQ